MPQLTVDDLLIIGIKGTVLALNSFTGEEIWRTKIKGYDFTNLTRDGQRIFASAQGEIFCLDAVNGRVLWSNPLRGMGLGIVTIANAAQAPAARQQASNDAAITTVMTTQTATT